MKEKILMVIGVILSSVFAFYVAWAISLSIGLVRIYDKHDDYISDYSSVVKLSEVKKIGKVFDPRCFGEATIYINDRNRTYRTCK